MTDVEDPTYLPALVSRYKGGESIRQLAASIRQSYDLSDGQSYHFVRNTLIDAGVPLRSKGGNNPPRKQQPRKKVEPWPAGQAIPVNQLEPLSCPCVDCGIATAPCTGKRGCTHIRRWEWYMVKDAVWREAGDARGYLCIACLESRLDRQLVSDDFTSAPINSPRRSDTMLLASRKAAT